ncbi:MAG: restriction endonuclease subunit S [Filifactoraceae bacterium]
MSKLDKLIEELCPDGVEYVTIETICEIQNGYTPSKKNEEYWTDGDVPWFRMEDIRTNGNVLYDSIQYVHNSGVKGSGFPADSLIFATTATIGFHALIKVPFLCNQQLTHIHIKDKYKGIIDIKYIFHYADIIDKMCKNNVKGGGTLQAVSLDRFRNFPIPIPPLEIQREIVRILDNFTELTAELTAELLLRKKQYEYYRDSLFTFNENLKWRTLKSFCDIGDGLHGTPKYDDFGEYYFVNGNNLLDGEIIFNSKTKKVNEGEYNRLKIDFSVNTILMSINGTIGNIAVYKGEKIVLGKSVAYFSIFSDLINVKFLYYYLQTTSAKKYFINNSTGSTIENLGLKALREFKIPVFSISEQQRIVDILDRFDVLCNDLSSGLPAEIEARKKQYEYYRDKLLTFKELS